MANKKDYAPRWPESKRPPHAHIDFGSPEHAALVGLPDEATIAAMDPEEVAARERLFKAEPVIACPERKQPINRRNYAVGENIIDGWSIYGRR